MNKEDGKTDEEDIFVDTSDNPEPGAGPGLRRSARKRKSTAGNLEVEDQRLNFAKRR